MEMSELLSTQLIVARLEAESKEDVLRVLFGKLYNAGFVKQSFLGGVIKREDRFPTGLQLNKYGVALPHTDVEHVIRPALAVATLLEPVVFRNMAEPSKEVRVNVVFMIALTKSGDQIETLQQLAYLLQNDVAVERIVDAKRGDEIIEIVKSTPLISD